MKHHLISALIILTLLTACATTGRYPSKPVQKVEYTLKQNLINLGITIVGSAAIVLGNGYIMSRTEDGLRDGIGSISSGMHRY